MLNYNINWRSSAANLRPTAENFQVHPQIQTRYLPKNQFQGTDGADDYWNSGSFRKCMIAIVVITVSVLVILAIVLAVTLTQVRSTSGVSGTTTAWPTTSSANGSLNSSTASPSPSTVSLTGNYTILNKQTSDVDPSALCNQMIDWLNKTNNFAINCTITSLLPGSVYVLYRIRLIKLQNETDDAAKRRGADALTRLLTNSSAFGYNVDPNSINFADVPQLQQTVESSQPTQAPENFCSNVTWIKIDGGYGYSTSFQSYITSPSVCQQECLARPDCYGITWSSWSIYGCYFNLYNSLFYNYGTYYSFYMLNRNQSNCNANRTCAYFWNGLYQRQALGGRLYRSLSTISSCIASCQINPGCSAVDWDNYQSYCWLFINNNVSSITRYYPNIYHFDKICRDPNVPVVYTTMTPPTGPQSSHGCPSWAIQYCEETQQCIFSSQICDKYQDCPNDIDETNCTCNSSRYQCLNGRCIYRSWLCDGVRDCPLGDDETQPQCLVCSSTQFTCVKSDTCIGLSGQCDGVVNCSDSSDEVKCLTLSGNASSSNNFTQQLRATFRGVSGYSICSDFWNVSFSDAACQHMGDRYSIRTYYGSVDTQAIFLVLNPNVSSPNIIAHLRISTCASNRPVFLACASPQCGVRTVPPDSIGPYLINGQRAKPGAWPWQAFYEIGYTSYDEFVQLSFCGAILLNERWLLTAGHCTMVTFSGLGYYGQVRPENVRISLGSLSRTGDNETEYFTVDSVFTHPLYTSSPVTDNDVGLLRLSEALDFTDFIRPICLPTSTDDLSLYRVCVDTGFGQTTIGSYANYLLQVRMNVVPYYDCYYYYNNYYLRPQTQICIGTLPTEGDNNICFGDSGGPFACQDFNGIWKVFGVNSYVIGSGYSSPSRCARTIVARVTAFVDWIQQTMAANSY